MEAYNNDLNYYSNHNVFSQKKKVQSVQQHQDFRLYFSGLSFQRVDQWDD
jgi:hypothetical protein